MMSSGVSKSRLQAYYNDVLRAELKKELNISNDHLVPRLEKVVLNMSPAKKALQDSKALVVSKEDLALISGQKPLETKAKKSIASFKLREGMSLGAKVTLRKKRMYDFVDRLVTMALPRIRNYQGASIKSFDDRANYALGIAEHTAFYEVDYNKVPYNLGLDIVFVTTCSSRRASYMLLKGLGIPFKGEISNG